MKSLKTFLFGVILCLLLAVKVQSQVCFYCADPPSGYPSYQYSLPNPLVNTTLTVFTQNPTFMNDVTEVSNQIALQIVTDIGEASEASSMNSILSMFTGGVLGGLGLGSGGQTISDLTNLFTTLASIVGQEAEVLMTQAAVSNYNSDVEAWNEMLNSFDGESIENIQSQLMIINDDLLKALSNYQGNPTFTMYPYYTLQPLYINAMLHLNVLSMLVWAEKLVGYDDSEHFQNETVSKQQIYLNLLESYANQTGPNRTNSITNVTCDATGSDYRYYINYTYSFEDNFLPANESPIVLQRTLTSTTTDCEDSYMMTASQASYVQAVGSGTAAYFNKYVTSVSNYNPNPGSASLLFV
jgi:hypothetical protein